MHRLLAPLAFLLVFGLATAAELPETMTLLCDDQVIGTAEYDDGELEVTLLEGFACTGTVSVEEDGLLMVSIEPTDDGFSVTITADPTDPVVATEVELDDKLDGPPADAGRPDDAGVDVSSLPQVAQDGMAKAEQNRQEAAERAADAGSEAEGDGPPEDAGRPDDAGRPEGVGGGDDPEGPEDVE